MTTGHETTSGMLSFLFVLLLTHSRAYNAARKEVDEVIGEGTITVEHLNKLPYITAVLRETSRLWSTAPGSRVMTKSENDADYPLYIGKKKFEIKKGDIMSMNMLKIHRDPSVYGETADEFIPERMLEENFQKLPRNAWKVGNIIFEA